FWFLRCTRKSERSEPSNEPYAKPLGIILAGQHTSYETEKNNVYMLSIVWDFRIFLDFDNDK
ncbi:MAG: hypothetical protein MUP82_10575, partial [Candidatus Marinimicrobia bacterium]|nr:hypothetical protein [Candidatus Neomarinimicrobiota bacterium]